MATGLGVNGVPITVVSGSTSGNSYICIGGVWKNISEVYICIGGVWKNATEINICISGTWKLAL